MPIQPIRFALLCAGSGLSAWQAECIRQLLSVDRVEPALLITEAEPGVSTSERSGTGADRQSGSLRALVPSWTTVHSQCVTLENVIGDTPRSTLRWERSSGEEGLRPAIDLTRIRDLRLDFILRFEFDPFYCDLIQVARYGLWSFYFGDESKGRSTPCGILEIESRESTIEASLVRLTSSPEMAVVLHKGVFKTSGHSLRANERNVLAACAGWPARICREIRLGNTSCVNAHPVRISLEGPPKLTLPRKARFLFNLGRNIVARVLEEAIEEKWTIGVVDAPIHACLKGELPREVKWLPEFSSQGFFADPFCVVRGDNLAILAEAYDYRSRRGHIVAIERVDESGLEGPIEAMRLPVHMSYPYLIEYGGEIYCLPETHQARKACLMRGDPFPYRWVEAGVLIDDFAAVDSTIFQFGDLWWLLCGNFQDQDQTKLFAWYAEDLLGPWEPHALNPVKCDVRSSRPAGPPFLHGGQLYRPAQDCSNTYGGAITINRIVRLDQRAFEEEMVTQIRPNPNGPYPAGLHTLCPAGDKTIIDGKRHWVSIRKLSQGVGWRLKRFARFKRVPKAQNFD